MLETATTTLKAQGHTVTVSDLYAMKFNPLVGRHDVVGGPAEGDIYKVCAKIIIMYTKDHINPGSAELICINPGGQRVYFNLKSS